jgi:uncharacterized coiled-coil DUF342 family protein
MEELRSVIRETEGNIRQLDQERESVNHQTEQLSFKLNSRQSEQKNMESLLNTELEKLRLMTDKHQQAHRRLEEIMAEVNEARLKFDDLIKFELNIRTKIETEKIKSSEIRQQITEKEELLNQLQNELENQDDEKAMLSKELDSLQNQMKLQDIQKRVYINQRSELTEQCNQFKDDHFGFSQEVFEITAQIDKLIYERDSYIRWIEELAASKQQANDRLASLLEEVQKYQNTYSKQLYEMTAMEKEIVEVELCRQNSCTIRQMITNTFGLVQKMGKEFIESSKSENSMEAFERNNRQLEEEIQEIRQLLTKERIEYLTLESESAILQEVKRRLSADLSQISSARREFAKTQPNIFEQIEQIKEDFAIELTEEQRISARERKVSFPEKESPRLTVRDFFKQISNDAMEHPGFDKDDLLINPISPNQDPFANDNSLISNDYLTQPRADSRKRVTLGQSTKHILNNYHSRPTEHSQRFIREYEAFDAEINRKSKFSAINDRDLSSSRLTQNKTQKHTKMHSTDSISKLMGLPDDENPEKRELMAEWSNIIKNVTRMVTFMLKTSSIFANSITLIVSKYQKDDKRFQVIRSHIVKSVNKVLQGVARQTQTLHQPGHGLQKPKDCVNQSTDQRTQQNH